MSKHTPTPWHSFGPIIHHNGQHVAHVVNNERHPDGDTGSPEQRANAEFIVRACNSFDDLLAACKAVAAALDRIQQDGSIVWLDDGPVHESASERLAWVIAKAEGTSDGS